MIKFPYNSGLIIVLRSEGGRPTMWLSLYPGPSVTRTREASDDLAWSSRIPSWGRREGSTLSSALAYEL
jgi:hypothetical protein